MLLVLWDLGTLHTSVTGNCRSILCQQTKNMLAKTIQLSSKQHNYALSHQWRITGYFCVSLYTWRKVHDKIWEKFWVVFSHIAPQLQQQAWLNFSQFYPLCGRLSVGVHNIFIIIIYSSPMSLLGTVFFHLPFISGLLLKPMFLPMGLGIAICN